jgi:hypothetical protein
LKSNYETFLELYPLKRLPSASFVKPSRLWCFSYLLLNINILILSSLAYGVFEKKSYIALTTKHQSFFYTEIFSNKGNDALLENKAKANPII